MQNFMYGYYACNFCGKLLNELDMISHNCEIKKLYDISKKIKQNKYNKIINTLGKDSQINKAKEELAELIVALCKNKTDNIKEEIADVKIMLKQLMIIYSFDKSEIKQIMKDKVKRTFERNNIK